MVAQPGTLMTWRCPSCGRILARVALVAGSLVEIKCRCNQTATLAGSASV